MPILEELNKQLDISRLTSLKEGYLLTDDKGNPVPSVEHGRSFLVVSEELASYFFIGRLLNIIGALYSQIIRFKPSLENLKDVFNTKNVTVFHGIPTTLPPHTIARLLITSTSTANRKTPFTHAMKHPSSWKILFSLIPGHEKECLETLGDIARDKIIDKIAGDSSVLASFFDADSTREWLLHTLFTSAKHKVSSFIIKHLIDDNIFIEYLQGFLIHNKSDLQGLMNDSDQALALKELFKTAEDSGETILHKACRHSTELFSHFCNLFENHPDALSEVLNTPNNQGETVLDTAEKHNIDSFNDVIKRFDPIAFLKERFFTEEIKDHHTRLHLKRLPITQASLKVVLSKFLALPAALSALLFGKRAEESTHLFERAVKEEPESLNTLLETIPEKDLIDYLLHHNLLSSATITDQRSLRKILDAVSFSSQHTLLKNLFSFVNFDPIQEGIKNNFSEDDLTILLNQEKEGEDLKKHSLFTLLAIETPKMFIKRIANIICAKTNRTHLYTIEKENKRTIREELVGTKEPLHYLGKYFKGLHLFSHISHNLH